MFSSKTNKLTIAMQALLDAFTVMKIVVAITPIMSSFV